MSNIPGDQGDIEQLSIKVLSLSHRTEHRLTVAHIRTVGKLQQKTREDLLAIRQFGVKSADEVDEALTQLYVTLQTRSVVEIAHELETAKTAPIRVPEEVLTLPITVLVLSSRPHNALIRSGATTVGDVLTLRNSGLQQVNSLGQKGVEEIQAALAHLAEHGILTNTCTNHNSQDVKLLVDPPDQLPVNLVALIIPLARAIAQVCHNEREYDVLKRRFGLETSKAYRLQEIGDYYELTRERVRQLEVRAIKRVRETFEGKSPARGCIVPQVVLDEAVELRDLVSKLGSIVSEPEIIASINARYTIRLADQDIGALHLLLTTLGFESVGSAIAAPIQASWSSSATPQSDIESVLKVARPLLKESVSPISFFDIKVAFNKKRKTKIDNKTIQLALHLCSEVESVGDEHYQVKLEYLPSLADKAYRVLSEAGEPLEVREIVRRVNFALANAGSPADAQVRSLAGQLGGDKRFRPVGRSGSWSLLNWQHVNTTSTLELMKEFFHKHGKGATLDEVTRYVQQKRTDISRNSIGMYLSMQTDTFIRVALGTYELAVWGGKEYIGASKSDSKMIQAKLEAEIRTFFQNLGTNIVLQRELNKHLKMKTGIADQTIYAYLKRASYLRQEENEGKPGQKFIHLIDTRQVPQKTAREHAQEEILAFLESQPERRARIGEVATYVLQKKICKDRPRFYYVLSRMNDHVAKEQLPGELWLKLKTTSPDVTPLRFPQIAQVDDVLLQNELQRAVNMLTIENVDLGLFQLGKLFEVELKKYIEEVRKRNIHLVTKDDLARLVAMIDWVERNKITNKKHLLTLLREQRNERAHGQIPDLEERKRLIQHTPFLADLYIEYITFFHSQRKAL